MGSDVGAGRSFSLKIAGGRAYDASLIHNKPISALQALDTSVKGKRDLDLVVVYPLVKMQTCPSFIIQVQRIRV